jgi:hypothetical protein
MKNKYFFLLTFFLGNSFFNCISAKDKGASSWMNKKNLARSNAFVQNIGQFDDNVDGLEGKEILFREDEPGMYIYFTTHGIVYKLFKREKISEKEWIKYAKAHKLTAKQVDGDDNFITKTDLITMNWAGGNIRPELLPEEPTDFYFNYYRPDLDKDKIFGNVKGYKKLLYKNVYPNIDVEYTIHPTDGIKYSFILHPGADVSMIKMNYSGADVSKDNNGNIILTNEYRIITDHAPNSYTGQNNTSADKVSSLFTLSGNSVGFSLDGSSNIVKQTTVIDPWIVGSPIPGFNVTPDDIAVDGSNNVIIYGNAGGTTNILQKYNSAGVLQWTYNLTTNAGYTAYQGDVQADATGNIYTTIGLVGPPNNYNTIKLNPAGDTLIWGSAKSKPSTTDMYETWTLAFNCDQTTLIQSGGGISPAPTTSVEYNVAVYEPVNIATGAEGPLQQSPVYGEITSTIFAPNGMLYHLASDSNLDITNSQKGTSTGPTNYLICVNPATFNAVFVIKTGYSYVDGDMKEVGSIGSNSMGASCRYLYTTDGLNLDQRNLTTGALIKRVTIPGGNNTASTSGVGSFPMVNGGIVTDKCGNVYIGTANEIVQYDENLNQLGTLGTLPGTVLDIALGSNNELYCTGASSVTGTTSFVAEIDLPACNPVNATNVSSSGCGQNNGSATVSADSNFCTGPFSYLWSPSGQTTQTATGLSPGTYTVTVSPQSGCSVYASDTITIGITSSINVTANNITTASCTDSNGTATINATGGIGTLKYTWAPNGDTGSSASNLAAGLYTVTVTDSVGCSSTVKIIINNTGGPAVSFNYAGRDSICRDTVSYIKLNGGAPLGGGYNGSGISSDTLYTTTVKNGWNNITYTYKDSNGCQGTATDSIYIYNCSPTGLNTISGTAQLEIYPNPSNGVFNITSSLGNTVMIEVYNNIGQLILNKEIRNGKGLIDLSKEAKGMYYMRVISNNRVYKPSILIMQ